MRSKMVDLLLLIYCFMYLSLFLGVLCWPLFWYALLYVLSSYVLSSFAIILARKREGWLVCFCVFQISCYCKYSAALPHGAVGWSAVCDSFHAQLDN